MSNERLELIRERVNIMRDFIPHAAFLGICFKDAESGKLTLRLPWREEIVGNPTTGSVHSGVITVLMDQALGLSRLCSDKIPPSFAPTLDLRIEHLGISSPRSDINVTTWVLHMTPEMIFSEGMAWCDTPSKPIAKGTASFKIKQKIDFEKLVQLREQSE